MAIRWANWASLGRPAGVELGRPEVQRNQDGRLEVFATGASGMFSIWQVVPGGGWHDGWASHSAPASGVDIKAHVVGLDADGRQEIFAVGGDGALWHRWQVAINSGWSGWASLMKPAGAVSLTEQLAAGVNQDGRQELFVLGGDGNVWQIWQTAPNGGWSEWHQLGKPQFGIRPSDRITLGRNVDRRQELFLLGNDGALWHVWQMAPNGGWSDWESLGRPRDAFDGSEPPKARDLSDPLVLANDDGHLEVFAPGNGAFCNRWQEKFRDGPNSVVWRHQGWNEKPRPRPDIGLTWLEAARNFERRLEVAGFADDGALWHAWQVDQPPFWSSWESLGSPSTLREADRLTIGTNPDGRLEVFVVDNEGAIWHIWQIR